MAKPLIIDCDPGIDDAVALACALFDPQVELIGATAVEGCVTAEQASRNLHAVIERLDPPRLPRLGVASPHNVSLATEGMGAMLYGPDGLGGECTAKTAPMQQRPSEKVLTDLIRAQPEQVTILCLGPLTNIANMLQRDPDLALQIHRLVIAGGTLSGRGDATRVAERNIYHDPDAARYVFKSNVTMTVVPLEVMSSYRMSLNRYDALPGPVSNVAQFLRCVLPAAFRAHRERLGEESVLLKGLIAYATVVAPDLFRVQEARGDVETRGELTTGMTIFDRSDSLGERSSMEIAVEADADGLARWVEKSLQNACYAA